MLLSHRTTSAFLRAHTHTHHRLTDNPCETQAYSAQSNKPRSHCSDIKQTINTNPISSNSWIKGNLVDKTCKKTQKTLNYWEARFKDQKSVVDHIEKTRNGILPITGLNKTNTWGSWTRRSKDITGSLISVTRLWLMYYESQSNPSVLVKYCFRCSFRFQIKTHRNLSTSWMYTKRILTGICK